MQCDAPNKCTKQTSFIVHLLVAPLVAPISSGCDCKRRLGRHYKYVSLGLQQHAATKRTTKARSRWQAPKSRGDIPTER